MRQWSMLKNLVCGLILFLCAAPAWSYLGNASPISAIDRAKKFPLTFICGSGKVVTKTRVVGSTQFSASKPVGPKGQLQPGCKFSLSGKSYSVVKEELQISGQNLKSEPWSVKLYIFTMAPTPFECTVFSGDLDGNGKDDLVIFRTTGACGKMPPQSHFTSVMFDDAGNPHAWEIGGFFELTKSKPGVEELLQDNNGHALLISEQCDYKYYPNYDVVPDLWKTIIYRADKLSWNLNKDYHGKLFPLVTPIGKPAKDDSETTTRHRKPSEFRNFENGVAADSRMDESRLVEFRYFYRTGDEPCLKTEKLVATNNDEYYEGFLISNGGKDWLGYTNDSAKAKMQTVIKSKPEIRYLKSAEPDHLPLYIWLE